MRVAIVGLGAAGRTIHIPALAAVGAEVVGGHDPSASPSHFPFALFNSTPELLKATSPDLLVVATPPDSHFALTRLGLEAGCHVLCEKPFVENLDQADEIIALAARTGRHVVVNSQFRFMRIHRAARDMIGSDEFGELQFVTMEQTFFVDETTEAGWRGKDIQRTAKDFGTHVLDLCRFFFAEEPLAISARMPKVGSPRGPDLLDLIQLEFSRDRVAQITLDRLSRGRHRYLDIRLDGERAAIETSIGGRFELATGYNPRLALPYLDARVAPGGFARMYRGERSTTLAREPRNIFAVATAELLRAFLSSLREGKTPPSSASDSRTTLALMLAAYEAAAHHTTIAFSRSGSRS